VRGRIILILSCVGITLLVYWGLDRIYFAPIEAAAQRAVDLSHQLATLRERELLAQRDQAALSGDEAPPQLSLVDGDLDIDAVTARFQEYARASVAQSGGLTISSQVTVAELTGGYSKVAVLLRMRFAERQLLAFARKIETDSPPVVFETLEIRPLPISADSHPLDVTATLTGFYGNADAQ
jgi:hypothetical protein